MNRLRAQWSRLRDRLLASPRFHRLALRTPVARWIARRRARQVFDLCAGFVHSQVLLACIQLELLPWLAERPRAAAEIAHRCDLGGDATLRLLRAAIPLGLVESRGAGRYGLGPLAAPLLADPGLQALIRHNALFYKDLTDPLALLRGTLTEPQLARYWAYARAPEPGVLAADATDDYSELMAASQAAIASQLIEAYDFSAHHRLLDVGGGDGAFCRAVARACPALQVMTADLPPVAERARRRFAAAGLADRARAWGGDFFREPLPDGADVVTLIRVVHDHDDARVEQLLRAARAALAPDGTLLIAEQMAATPGAETVGDTYFGLYLLAMGSGRPRSRAAIEALLDRCGFGAAREIPLPLPLTGRLLVAHPERDRR